MKKLLLFLTGFLIMNSVFCTTFTVTNINDSGAGSLRQAITSANADATATVATPHIIDATVITGTINLLTYLPDISKHMNVNGPTSGTLTVSCSTTAGFRLFGILANTTVNMSNLTMTKGKGVWPGGGAVNNAGTFTITNCIISNCSFVAGDYVFGGGVYTTGNLTINNCTINNNLAINGGGIAIAGGTTTISNSTIKDNTTDGSGGGGNGGGIYMSGGVLNISNSTVSGNSTSSYASGGGIAGNTAVTISNCTISGNISDGSGGGVTGSGTIKNTTISGNSTTGNGQGLGGGVYGDYSIFNSTIVNNTSNGNGAGINGNGQISNSIVVGNTNSLSGNLNDISGTLTSTYGHNIFGGNPTINGAGMNMNYKGALITDVLNSTLADNGGLTKTHALISCSYAINNGTISGSPATDQRGVARTDSVDIGAYESPAGSSGKPFITSQPTTSSVCIGAPTVITLGIGGLNITYQWQVNSGDGVFSDIIDGGIYSGANTSKLSISSTTGLTNYKYQCVVTSSTCSTTLTSDEISLDLKTAPAVANLQDFGLCQGANISRFVNATGGGLSYQWQIDKGTGFVNLTNDAQHFGATSGGISIGPGSSVMNGWKYRVIVSNSCGPSATSNSATLTYNTNLAITTQPTNQSICSGGNATFSVANSGVGANYQWQVYSTTAFDYVNITNDGTYANVTTKTLTITGVDNTLNNAMYRCQLQNHCTFINGTYSVSQAAKLTTKGATITSQSSDQTVCTGFSTSLNVEANASETINYKWQIDQGSGFVDITDNSTYTGSADKTLNINNVGLSMNGYKYKCLLTTATCPTPIISTFKTLTVNAAPVITNQPVNTTSWNNGDAKFSVTVNGNALTYKWQLKKPGDADFANINDGAQYTNTSTNQLTVIAPVSSMNGYQFRSIIQSGDCPSNGMVTNEVTLSVSEAKICMVTVDDATGKNMIVFEKPSNSSTIESFEVFREGSITNQYDLIGSVPKTTMSTFVDVNSDPTQQPYIYKLAVKDINNVTSPLSAAHKTMHLSINKGVGSAWNLLWNGYEGIAVNTYNIYRGIDASSLSLINSVSGNINSYTDNNAPAASNIFYQIEIVMGASCTPTAKVSAFASVRSNIAETQKAVTNISNSIADYTLEVYPNPATDRISIKNLPANSSITLYDLSGQPVKIVSDNVSIISTGELSRGMYILEVKNASGSARTSIVIE